MMMASNTFRIGFVLVFAVLMVTLMWNVKFTQESNTCECLQCDVLTTQQNTLSRFDNLSIHETPSPTPIEQEKPKDLPQEMGGGNSLPEDGDELCDGLTPEQLLPPFPEQLPCPRRVPRDQLPRCTNATQILRGGWDSSKTWFEPDGCNIKRFTQEEAASCFAGKTIAFVGDSTIASLWRQTRKIFGEETTLFGGQYDEEALNKTRKPHEPRLSFLTTYYHEKHQFLFRHYMLWNMDMFDTMEHAGRDANHTIVSVLRNKTHDAVFINLGAHHQTKEIKKSLNIMTDFYHELDRMVRSRESVPLVFMSTNAQVAEKKKNELSKHQTFRLSRVLNELAHWVFELVKPQVIPMMDFSFLMEKGFPWSTYDGMHSVEEVEYVKWQVILNFMCPEDGFTTIIPN